jgi:hypothetical protein
MDPSSLSDLPCQMSQLLRHFSAAAAQISAKSRLARTRAGCDCSSRIRAAAGSATSRTAPSAAPGNAARRSPPGSRNSQDPGRPSPAREGGGDAATTANLGQRSDATSAALLRTKKSSSESGSGFPFRLRLPPYSQRIPELPTFFNPVLLATHGARKREDFLVRRKTGAGPCSATIRTVHRRQLKLCTPSKRSAW